MRQKLGLATSLGARPAVLLGLLALTLLSVVGWAGMAQAQFDGTVSYVTTGAAPWSPSFGDLNNDGWPDLVVANSVDNNVSIFFGNGDGTFQTPATTLSTGTGPRATALGYLNTDGNIDLVVANYGTDSTPGNTVSVFLGNGNGTFQTPTTVTVRTNPNNLILGDLNRDGKLDLLVTNYGSGNVSVFLGIGDGTFSEVTGSPFSTGTKPMALRLGDLNSDGNPDLVVVNYESNTVSILIGSGGGNFGTPATISTNTGPTGVRLADLNDDGVFDLVVANSGTLVSPGSTVSVFLGNKNELGRWDGTFQPKADYTTEAGPTAPHLADMNADGSLDLIVVNTGATAAKGGLIFPGNGDGTFDQLNKVYFETAVGPTGVAVADLNGDGMPDLAVAGTNNGTGTQASIFKNTTAVLAIFPNGSGLGDVTSDIGGIICPSSPTVCRAYFSSTAPSPTVTLTAAASPGSTFIGWSGGGCSGFGTTCTVSMDKSRAIAAMFQKDGTSGFALADLAGTWFLTFFKDSVTGNDPGWTSLKFSLDANGIVTGTDGNFIDSSGHGGSLAPGDGAFIIDGAGLISGWAGPQGGRVNFPYGKLSPSKTILAALSVKGPNGRGIIVGTKGGGSFTPSDLAGTWSSSYFTDYFPMNDPSWASVSMVMDTSGAVTSGNYTPSHNTPGTLNGGMFPINSFGVITSASVTSLEGGGPTFSKGKMDASKTMLATVANEDPNGRGAIIGIKGGGSFSTADLEGTWYFVSYLDRFPTNGPQWAVATLTLNASGALTNGSFVSSFGNFGTHDSGSFTLNADGTGSGQVAVGGGGKSFPHLKMDPSKSIIVSVILEAPNGIGISLGIKGGSVFHPTLNVAKAGTGTITSSLGSINCGDTCLATFNANDSVTLTATADSGSNFTGWSGDCTGTDPCALTMTQAKSVTATFALTTNYTLTASVGGSSAGSVSGSVNSNPTTISGCTGTCTDTFPISTVVTLTATPSPGAGGTFKGWRGDACNNGSTNLTCEITMNGTKAVTAVFSKTFTDPTLAAGMSIKAVHFNELRDAINALRSHTPALPPFNWVDAAPTSGGAVLASHLANLRTALSDIQPQTYVESTITPRTTGIKASHLTELRDKVRGLE